MSAFLAVLIVALLVGYVVFTFVRFRTRRAYQWVLAGAVLLVLPVAVGIAGGYVAEALGCVMNESGPYPCVVGGVDLGGLLSFLAVIPWLGLVTLPFALVLSLVALVLFVAGRRASVPL